MYKIIITYELFFLLFWNILYFSRSGVEDWFTEEFLSAFYVFLSTMALGFCLVYVIYISAKLSGFIDKIKTIKDPRNPN